MIAVRREYEATGGKFIEHEESAEIFPGAWLTGPVPRKYPERNWSVSGKVQTPVGLVEDTIPEDQSYCGQDERVQGGEPYGRTLHWHRSRLSHSGAPRPATSIGGRGQRGIKLCPWRRHTSRPARQMTVRPCTSRELGNGRKDCERK